MIKSATRVLDVLEVLAASPAAIRTNEIARRLAIPRSSASLLLRTLLARGYVTRDGGGAYRVRLALMREWAGDIHTRLVAVARPVMLSVVERTAETAFLGVLTPDWHVQYLDKVVSPREVRYDTDIATRRQAHCTSTGLVLLAHRPERDIARFLRRGPLERFTSRTLTTPSSLVAELRRIRAMGYAVNIDGRVIGASGVAAPIRASADAVVAALNVSAPTARFADIQHRITEAVVWGAAEISRRLGWTDMPARQRRARGSK